MAVLLQDGGRERAATDHVHALVVLFQLVHERNEVAVAAHNRKSVDVVVGERHFEGVQRQVDIRAVLVAARRRIALHHLHGVLGELAREGVLAAPIGVGNLCNDSAALLQSVEHRLYIEFPLQSGFNADLDVVEVDKYGDLEFLVHSYSLAMRSTSRAIPWRLLQG